MNYEISYGKEEVTVYRTYAKPMSGLTAIPESAFTGKQNILFAVDVGVEVFGNNFLPAYTEGDNRNVVATDTMKNFVLKQAIAYNGSTLEGFLYFLGQQFLANYTQMHYLRITGNEQHFMESLVPKNFRFLDSNVFFSRFHDDRAIASLYINRDGDNIKIVSHECGRVGLQLIKITGSSFASFDRDNYTTLPEVKDRPLFIYLDVFWKYDDAGKAINSDLSQYIAPEQVRDFVQVVFHEFVSKSIQHLIHEIGIRLLNRFPQMTEVYFEAQNRLWDTAFVSEENEKIKVYCDPRPPYGMIKLKLTRS